MATLRSSRSGGTLRRGSGSDLGYSDLHPPGYPPFPGPLVHRLARAMPVIRIHGATNATLRELEAVTMNRGWCPDDAGNLWPVRVSTVLGGRDA